MRRGLAPSVENAREEIASGRVVVAGAAADKPSRLVAPGEPVRLLDPPPRFVSRGGEKLEAALHRFDVAVEGLRALDAGASTGGFTDCLLQRGAVEVVAVDVGHAQLHERLCGDPRVVNRERLNIRTVQPGDLGARFQLVVADLSFISLRTVLSSLLAQADSDADLVLLLKPQFEAARAEVSRGKGVISDPAVWRRVVEEIRVATEAAGAAIMGAMVSPLRGADGNVEFLIHAVPLASTRIVDGPAVGAISELPSGWIDALMAEATESVKR